MDEQADKLAAAIRVFLREQIQRSDAARQLAIELARFVLAEAEQIQAAASDEKRPGTPQTQTAPRSQQAARDPVVETPQTPKRSVTLAIGDSRTTVEVAGSAADAAAAERAGRVAEDTERPGGSRPADIDLGLLASRSRLKAESCRVYTERRDAAGDDARERPVLERMNRMIAQAKAMPDCFLWAFWPREEQPSDARLEVIALCYEALAEAAELTRRETGPTGVLDPTEIAELFQCLAEASSALRVAMAWTWLSAPDHDQDEAHLWLRRETQHRGVFVGRFMRLDDAADPGRAADLLEEIRALGARAERRREQSKLIDSLLNRVRYHAGRLPETGAGEAHDCRRIAEACDSLAELGVRPTDTRVSTLRGRVRLDAFPDDVSVTEATRTLLTEREPRSSAEDTGPGARTWSARVTDLRRLLAGGSVVVVGGESRPDAIERMRDAFGLATVEWVALTEHGTGSPMRAPIQRAETRLVLVLIKLCGHLHAEEAREYAREAGVPCVLMPAGYNPEQIAEQVHTQVAQRLIEVG